MNFPAYVKSHYCVVAKTTPSVYVGTYKKYNDGNLKGKWLNLEDYKDKEDFYKAAAELHKDEEDPELMFQDFEGFPKSYYGESSLDDTLWDWLELDDDDRELLEVYVDEFNDDKATIDQAREAFMGKFKSETDWAQDYIEDSGGLSAEQAGHYLTISPTDARLIASEEGDSYIEGLDDEEILKQADKQDDYDGEEDDAKKEKILDAAKEDVSSTHSDEVEKKLNKDPVGYFVDDIGAYSIEDLAKANFMSIDYEAYARDAASDLSFVHHNGEVWVFSSH